MADKVVVQPVEEPVTLKQAKAHLRVTHCAEDELISHLIVGARQVCEQEIQRPLVTQDRALYLSAFPTRIELAQCPVQQIILVEYLDVNGDPQVLAPSNYILDEKSEPSWIVLAAGAIWPMTACQPNAVTVSYRAGYGDAADVPVPIKQAMLLLIGHFYSNRENSIIGTTATNLPFGVDALLAQYRLRGFV